ncbi:seven transmembrane MLO family protein [Actinidia rufa]|uniref:Seven transmembrane MLO family protein n=1 Tax=Actinidia rufa TaxID=165716 RepID=A0A7J0E6C7_9ERIC|nr:seven transmembrane MLO family protein [Actinidia rufa]
MLLGFISLLLTVFQNRINTICISRKVSEEWLPCAKKSSSEDGDAAKTTAHFLTSFIYGSPIGRRLLAEASGAADYCGKQEGDKVPLLSTTALHHLHIFIFALAVSHVTFCVLTIVFGGIKIHWWKHWEDSILKEESKREQEGSQNKFTHVQDHDFIRKRFRGIGKHSALRGWVLLLAVGTKLEHVITQLANDVAEKHVTVEGDLVVKPSDEHFWFNRPRLVLILIHLILFQNSFEIAFFFWIWAQYSFDSCIMGKVGLIIPRLIIGVFVQFLCSYSTLPLYAIVTQAIFEDHIQEGLVGWAQKARNKGLRKAANNGSSQVGPKGSVSASIQMAKAGDKESAMEEGNATGEIEPATVLDTHK